ncbi:MAG: molybdopterin-dependent oxidoreductase, partial [Gammaproteobacteria bacterium]|nr:molybdopterin-dependent oxidoreductase [Gammaproteobacteria bacterium]
MLLTGTNMISSFANASRLAAGLSNVDLIVCHDLFSNATIRAHADIVLPATAWLEQLGCKMTHTHLYLMDKMLPAPSQCHSLSEVLQGLGEHLDVADFFPWPNDEAFIDSVIN